MTAAVLDLSDAAALDAAVVGAKAATLAQARAAGLPVLPGVVIPVAASRGVVDAAVAALKETGSLPRARLAAMAVRPDRHLLAALRARLADTPAPLIVRSSSPLEADGTWSGAFSTFHGISHDDLETAIAGTWGSAFSVTVLNRAEGAGTPPDRLGLAVLVQPELQPDIGGTARLADDGSVHITSTRGPLRPLMEGHIEGDRTTVLPGGATTTSSAGLDARLAARVAELVHKVNAVLGHQLIEWAVTGERLYLLQSIRSTPHVTAQGGTAAADPVLRSAVAVRVARLAQRSPGPLWYELVLPWAVALREPLPAPAPSALPPDEALAAARTEAAALIAQVWGGGAAEADQVLRELRGPAPAAALRALDQLRQPDRARAAVVLGHLDRARSASRADRLVTQDAAFWRFSAADLAQALRERAAPAERRLGVDLWEPFVHSVVMACGTSYAGTPAAPGAGAGPAYLVDEQVMRGGAPEGRYVLVARRPLPSLAPLLWNAAGMVIRAGTTAAHVLEFAASIGVPTVVGCPLPDIPTDGRPESWASTTDCPVLLAVDGDRGYVAAL
jgi:pyruvate,water dikinase